MTPNDVIDKLKKDTENSNLLIKYLNIGYLDFLALVTEQDEVVDKIVLYIKKKENL